MSGLKHDISTLCVAVNTQHLYTYKADILDLFQRSYVSPAHLFPAGSEILEVALTMVKDFVSRQYLGMISEECWNFM